MSTKSQNFITSKFKLYVINHRSFFTLDKDFHVIFFQQFINKMLIEYQQNINNLLYKIFIILL